EPLPVRRRGEGAFSYLAVVQDGRGLKERLLRLARQAALEENPRGCHSYRAHRGGAQEEPRNVRLPAGARGAARPRGALRSAQGGPADAESRNPRLRARQEEEDHPPRSPGHAGSGPREEELPCHRPGQALDSGHHLRQDRRGLPPPSLRAGRLLEAYRRLVDGFSPAHRDRGRRPGDGRVEEEAGRRPRPPLGQGHPVHGALLRKASRGGRHRALDGGCRLGTGQRHLRELRRDAEGRARPHSPLPDPRSGEERRLRVPGGVLQPEEAALLARIRQPGGLRGPQDTGGGSGV
ncbi:MAG: Mobile element protein, partial [uncultured Rubrobacteraceae bacterium]